MIEHRLNLVAVTMIFVYFDSDDPVLFVLLFLGIVYWNILLTTYFKLDYFY